MATLPARFGGYVLLESLGSGAMGDVHLARPLDSSRGLPSPLVIKRLHGSLTERGDFVRRFRHEAEIATSVDDPHVAKVYDVGAVGPTLYIAMEHVSGWPLSKVLASTRDAKREISLASAANIVTGALAGLSALHTATDPTGAALGIVHRDISPKNLMMGADGRTRLIDLGLGKSRRQDWKTQTGVVMGSPGYMAPEQVTAESVDHRADLYAIGIVFFELLTSKPYVPRGTIPMMLAASVAPRLVAPSSIRAEVPPGLDAVVLRSLAHDPDERFQSASEMADAIRREVPEAPSEESMRSMIDHMLWTALDRRRTAVVQLLADELPDTIRQTHMERQIVFAHAPGVGPSEASLLAPTDVRAREDQEGGSLPPTRQVTAPMASRPSVKVPVRTRVNLLRAGASIAALGLAIVVGMQIERFRRGAGAAVSPRPSRPVSPPHPSPRPGPTVAPAPVPSAPPPPLGKASPVRAVARGRRGRRPRRAPPAAVEPPPPPAVEPTPSAPAAAGPPTVAEVQALIGRASELARRLEGPAKDQAVQLRIDLELQAAAAQSGRASRATVARLTKRLQGLERGAHP